MRLKIRQRAEAGEVFEPYAFEHQVGKTIPFNVGERRGRCTLVAAEVAEDGRSALLTIDTGDPAARVAAVDPDVYRLLPGLSIRLMPVPVVPAVEVHHDLHAHCRYPGWEYETTQGPRKVWDSVDRPPEGDGWERNVDRGDRGWERFDYHEESYWRRPEA